MEKEVLPRANEKPVKVDKKAKITFKVKKQHRLRELVEDQVQTVTKNDKSRKDKHRKKSRTIVTKKINE